MIAIALAAPVLAVVVLITASLGRDGDASGGPTTTVAPDPSASTAPAAVDDEWNAALEQALRPLSTALTELAGGADRWSNGALDDDGFAKLLAQVEPAVESVRAQVSALGDHPTEALATPLVEAMAELYVRAVDAHGRALDATDPDLAAQYDRLGRRLRILGDRVFDRARERTLAPVDPGPDVRLVLPAEVPDWNRLELSAGPPLEPTSSDRPDATPLEREDERATQPGQAWRDDVAALDAPGLAEIDADVGDADALGAHARALVVAAEAMRSVPVPGDDRGLADRVALGWLIAADAARAAQLAALGDGSPALAEALLAVAAGDVFSVPPA